MCIRVFLLDLTIYYTFRSLTNHPTDLLSCMRCRIGLNAHSKVDILNYTRLHYPRIPHNKPSFVIRELFVKLKSNKL